MENKEGDSFIFIDEGQSHYNRFVLRFKATSIEEALEEIRKVGRSPQSGILCLEIQAKKQE